MDAGNHYDQAEANATTLGEALDRYAREVTPGKKGAKQELIRIAAWKRSVLADRPLSKVRGMDIAEWRDERLAAGRAPTMVRNNLVIISHLYTVARTDWGMTGLSNPVQDIRLPKPGPGRDRRLVDDEEGRLLDAAPPQMREAIIVLIETAMRRGELVSLRWEHIDLQSGVARIQDTKTGTPRDVPLSPRAIDTLFSMPRRIDGMVFGYTPDSLTQGFRKVCAKAGIRDLRLYNLRHEGTSRLVESGLFGMVEIAAITGHKTMVMLRRYSHPRAADMAEKMRRGSPL